jgi:glycosyltransferase involved in cell wall biosynthesis
MQKNQKAVKKTDTLVIIPAFNEEKCIKDVIAHIKMIVPWIDIVVVNDGSHDNTSRVAESAGAVVLDLPSNYGYGAALETGFKYAHQLNYSQVVTCDGDGQHDPKYIAELLKELGKGFDLIVGSRFLMEGNYKPPVIRKLGMKAFSSLAKLTTGLNLTDTTSGYQAFNDKILNFYVKEINYPDQYPDVDLLILCHRRGFKIREIGVRMSKSVTGKSMHSGLKPIFYVLRMMISILISLSTKRKK